MCRFSFLLSSLVDYNPAEVFSPTFLADIPAQVTLRSVVILLEKLFKLLLSLRYLLPRGLCVEAYQPMANCRVVELLRAVAGVVWVRALERDCRFPVPPRPELYFQARR